jgi:hypothetical protein
LWGKEEKRAGGRAAQNGGKAARRRKNKSGDAREQLLLDVAAVPGVVVPVGQGEHALARLLPSLYVRRGQGRARPQLV